MLAERQQVTLWFVFNKEILALFAGEFRGARLLCVKMIKAGLAGKNLAVFRKF